MNRQSVNGVVLIPELFKLYNSSSVHKATRYRIYADRARGKLLLDTIRDDESKLAYSYTPDNLYDDMVIYFTTNIRIGAPGVEYDDKWCGESPLTKIVLRKDKFASTGIIGTPVVVADRMESLGDFNIMGDNFVRYDSIAVHESTSFKIIDESDGTVVFLREDDRNNLKTMYIPPNTLSINKIYRMMIRYKDVVGRWSNWGSAIYPTTNVLYDLFNKDTYYVVVGTTLTLTKATNVLEEVDNSKLQITLTKAGAIILTQIYTTSFTFVTTGLVAGDLVKGVIQYGGALYRDIIIHIVSAAAIPDPTSTPTATPIPTNTPTPSVTAAPDDNYYPAFIHSVANPLVSMQFHEAIPANVGSTIVSDSLGWSPTEYTYYASKPGTLGRTITYSIAGYADATQTLSNVRILDCVVTETDRITTATAVRTFIAIGFTTGSLYSSNNNTLKLLTVTARGLTPEVLSATLTTVANAGAWTKYKRTSDNKFEVYGDGYVKYVILSNGTITTNPVPTAAPTYASISRLLQGVYVTSTGSGVIYEGAYRTDESVGIRTIYGSDTIWVSNPSVISLPVMGVPATEENYRSISTKVGMLITSNNISNGIDFYSIAVQPKIIVLSNQTSVGLQPSSPTHETTYTVPPGSLGNPSSASRVLYGMRRNYNAGTSSVYVYQLYTIPYPGSMWCFGEFTWRTNTGLSSYAAVGYWLTV